MIVVGVNNGVVDICVSVDTIEILSQMYPEHIFLEQVGEENIGWTYEGGSFSPPPGKAFISKTCITNLAFISRFTDEEAIAIAIDLASQGTTPMAAMMRRVQKKSETAEYIDLSDIATRNGVFLLEQYGLISPGRALEILDAPPLGKELFKG